MGGPSSYSPPLLLKKSPCPVPQLPPHWLCLGVPTEAWVWRSRDNLSSGVGGRCWWGVGKDPHSLSGNPLRTGYHQGARGQLGKRNERQRPVSSFPHSQTPGATADRKLQRAGLQQEELPLACWQELAWEATGNDCQCPQRSCSWRFRKTILIAERGHVTKKYFHQSQCRRKSRNDEVRCANFKPQPVPDHLSPDPSQIGFLSHISGTGTAVSL